MKSLITLLILFTSTYVFAARLKDIANVRGVRTNQLVGYGLVVGLNGTGDSAAEFTSRSMKRMLDKVGMKIGDGEVTSKNVAAVIITASLPPFARAGNPIDLTINSIGDASSLRGGTLVQTPLRAADQQIYVVGQGPVLVGYSQAGVHETVARIPGGGIIERDMGSEFAGRKMFRLTLHNPDFTTAARVARRINIDLSGKFATAKDASTIDLVTPPSYEGKGVELLAMIESLQVNPDKHAKVVVNERTGTVVVGEGVRVTRVAISHGNLTVKVGGKDKGPGDSVLVIDNAANVGDLVKAMNRLGVSPKDLITILQSIKAAGALHGEIEIL
ncbi:MAG: flagellar biosynthesis protein FlgA [Bdellovibrionaceae bacterium]|nr:flagellar biosynthesis protein FlgA [Pseudobdellovibrionaceae bacterium]